MEGGLGVAGVMESLGAGVGEGGRWVDIGWGGIWDVALGVERDGVCDGGTGVGWNYSRVKA